MRYGSRSHSGTDANAPRGNVTERNRSGCVDMMQRIVASANRDSVAVLFN